MLRFFKTRLHRDNLLLRERLDVMEFLHGVSADDDDFFKESGTITDVVEFSNEDIAPSPILGALMTKNQNQKLSCDGIFELVDDRVFSGSMHRKSQPLHSEKERTRSDCSNRNKIQARQAVRLLQMLSRISSAIKSL